MKPLLIVLFTYLYVTTALASSVEVESQVLLVNPSQDGTLDVINLYRVSQKSGDFEVHSREGRPNYRGVPWNVRAFLSEEGQVRVVFWIDDVNYWLEKSDELLIDESFDATDLRARNFDLYKFDDGSKLLLTMTPHPIAPKLDNVQLTEQNMGLNFFCLKNSAVVVDENYYLGSFTGFGEKLIVGAPGLAKVSMSFNPIYDWTPIGSYQDGVIEIPLEAGHLLTVHAVKYGPGGFDVGGPFTVYGSIDPPETTLEHAREILDLKISKRFTGDRLKVLRNATANNPFAHMGRGTIGNSTKHSDHFIQAGAHFGRALTECSF